MSKTTITEKKLIEQCDHKVKERCNNPQVGCFEVPGFDYYNTKTGEIESGGTEKMALWMLDIDYYEWSLFPLRVFFPMSGEKEGWSRLAKNLKAEVDKEPIEAYRGTVSLPIEGGGTGALRLRSWMIGGSRV